MATPASARAHIDAVMTYLSAASITAYRGEAPANAAAPFVIVWPSPAAIGSNNLIDANECRVDFQTTAVGVTAEQAEWMSDKVTTTLWRATPSVTGRTVRPIYSDEVPQPVRRDDALAQPLFYAVKRWTFISSV